MDIIGQTILCHVRAPAHWGLEEIDGLLVPPDKASNLLIDHLITG